MHQAFANNKLSILAGVLGAQVVLAVLLFWQGDRQQTVDHQPVVAIADKPVDQLQLRVGDKSLTLNKVGQQWRMANGLPAQQARAEQLLDSLAQLKTGWPVARSEAAHERFEVSDDNFQRKITLISADNTLATLYLGSSPSFKQVHLRRQGEKAVYALSFDAYQASAEADDWLAMDLLQPEGTIREIRRQGKSLTRDADGDWPLPVAAQANSDSEGGEQPADDAAVTEPQGFDAEAFIESLQGLRVLGIAANKAEFDAPAAEDSESGNLQKWRFSVTTSEGGYDYELLSRDSNYYIRRDDFEQTFRLSKSQFEALAKVRGLDDALAANS